MEWSNENTLEFIQNYESEPLLWNPQDPNHKKKHLNYDAWLRIKTNLNWPVTVEELKVKMKSLMAYYRTHLNKYKKSLKSGAGKDDIYQTNWFAFSAMNSFLAPVYECQPTISTLQVKEEYETQDRIDTEDSTIEERPKFSVGKKPRKDNVPQEIIEAKQQMQAAFENIKTSMNDEYEMFGKLIANKIKNLKNHNTREIVMNDIYNLIFRAGMIDRLEQSTPSRQSTSQSPHHQTYLPSQNPSTSQSPQHQAYLPSPNPSTSQSPQHQTYLPSPNPSTSQSPQHQTYLPSPNRSTSQSPHHQAYLPSPNPSTSQSPQHQTYLPSPNPSTSQSPQHQTYLPSPNPSTSQSPQHQTYLPSPNRSTSQSPHHQTYLPSPNRSTSQSPQHQTYLPSPNRSKSQSPQHQTYLPYPNPSTYQSPQHQTYLPSANPATYQSPQHQTYVPSANPATSQSPHACSVNSDESFIQSTQQTYLTPPTKMSQIIITETGKIQVVAENPMIN